MGESVWDRRSATDSQSVESATVSDWLARAFADHQGEALRYRGKYRARRVSYPTLLERARRGAALLAARGLGRGDAALILGTNGPDWVTAFLSCVFAGVVAVPLDPRSRPELARRVAAEVAARLVFRSRAILDPGVAAPTLLLDNLAETLAPIAEAEPVPVGPDDTLEILYTSGTTGDPKGVIVTHRNVASELASLRPVVDELGLPRLVLLSVLPLSHVLEQVVGLLLILGAGGTVVYVDRLAPPTIARALRSQGVTVMLVVPRVLELLANSIRSGAPRPIAGLPDTLARLGYRLPESLARVTALPVRRAFAPDLRYFVCGGATLDAGLEAFFRGLGLPVLQGYGLTETSSAATLNRPGDRVVGSVGKAMPGQELRIGESSEILVRGANVTPGYYRAPAATTAAFADGWFRTGDAGRIDASGHLWLLARLKEIIVTASGANVYPEDVESALRNQPGLLDCAVVEWRGHVHAALLIDPTADAAPGRIVAAANRQLDSAQQILGYTVWGEPDLPRTPTGKVARRLVREALDRGSAPPIQAPSPRRARGPNPVDLIAEVSGRPAFEIGSGASLGPDLHLSSIDRIELVARIETDLGVSIDETVVRSETTVDELRRLVESGERQARRESFPRWASTRAARAIRGSFQRWLLLPFLRHYVDLDVLGSEHLDRVEPPVVFAANHTSRLDVPALLAALPEKWRQHAVPVARAEFFEAPGKPARHFALRLLYRLVALGFGAILIPQYRGFRASLRYAGELADSGESLLFFPEGRQSLDGEIGAFREGIGLLASALELPVVPIRLTGLLAIARGSELWPRRRGRARVTFGAPLHFHGESYAEIAREVETAVRALD